MIQSQRVEKKAFLFFIDKISRLSLIDGNSIFDFFWCSILANNIAAEFFSRV